MRQILIVTSRPENFSELAAGLEKIELASIVWSDSAEAALTVISGETVHLAIIDETVGDQPGLKIARAMLMKNAMVNQAVVSRLSPETFHETSEGLGIMAQLPPKPDVGQAKRLMEMLKALTAN